MAKSVEELLEEQNELLCESNRAAFATAEAIRRGPKKRSRYCGSYPQCMEPFTCTIFGCVMNMQDK